MKVLLTALIFYMNPETRKIELLWYDTLPQESIEKCKKTGDRFKYEVEAAKNIDAVYFCHVQ